MMIKLITHLIALGIGFAGGIYALPILLAPPAPTAMQINNAAQLSIYKANFIKDLEGSDMLHFGEGEVSINDASISFIGKISPGPDFKLYLSPEFVETKEDFLRLKNQMARVGDVKTFNNFIVDLPADVVPEKYNTVIIWCESFGQFITAAKYR